MCQGNRCSHVNFVFVHKMLEKGIDDYCHCISLLHFMLVCPFLRISIYTMFLLKPNLLAYHGIQVKVFGSLVKGLRVGIDLLIILQEEGHLAFLLSKICKLPMLNGGDGLNKFLTQFEAAVDSDFPKYQVCCFKGFIFW